jgi:SAM-dependent methyltransferase
LTRERVHYESSTGGVVFDDTRDHFENAVVRLAVDRDTFGVWLDASGRQTGELEGRLRKGYEEVRPEWTARPSGRVLDASLRVLHPAIAENRGFGVAVDDARSQGFLIRPEGDGFVREMSPPVYEEAYFEGGASNAGGYGQYLAQAGWRLEKAARQVRELAAHAGVVGGRVLDVGSGYGFFRKALSDAGYEHAGIEISAHARRVAHEIFGMDSFEVGLGELAARGERFDAVTLFDLIEHVPDPVALLRDVRSVLAPGGVVAIKTPNLECPEAEIFGAAYHSFKREHLVYFTPRSLERAASQAGLEPVYATTLSHLLVGFFGSDTLRAWEAAGRGADVLAYFRRPPVWGT